MATENPQRIFPFMNPIYERFAGCAYPLVRFFTGLMLMPHGAQKLFGWFGGDINATAAFFAKIGLDPALPLAYLVGAVEFFGGLLIAVGLLTRPAAVAAFVLLMVATFNVHFANGFFWTNGGYEYPLLWGILILAIALRGGHTLSLDRKIGKEF